MSLTRPQGKKSGNPVLLYLAAGLFCILLGLIFLGTRRTSTIDQLLEAAAPDSSGYIGDSSMNAGLVAGDQVVEEEEKEPETKADTAKPVVEVVPVAKDTNSASNSPETAPATSTNGTETILTYVIKRGDTMYKIAAKFGNKPADIMALNGLQDMSVQADKPIKVKIKGVHAVSDGEGLNAIAEKFAVPAKSIRVANGLSSDIIPAGTSLIIPLK